MIINYICNKRRRKRRKTFIKRRSLKLISLKTEEDLYYTCRFISQHSKTFDRSLSKNKKQKKFAIKKNKNGQIDNI